MSSADLLLITGSSGGIGLNLTEFLVSAGWRNILCHYRTRSDEIARVLRKHNVDPTGRLLRADLTQEDQVSQLRQQVEASFGNVYAVVNAAGGSTNNLTWKLSTAEFQQVMDQNVLTTFLTCREFAQSMRAQGRGRIINISSVAAYAGAPGAAHYCAAKAAVIGFSRALALELAPKNIPVSVVALGYFQYGLIDGLSDAYKEDIRGRIPARRFGAIAELGGLVRYLLSEAGAYCGGQVYHLNGGLYT